MIIYRVHEAFHDPSESGTHEYGYFTTHDAAKKRALDVWVQKKYPDDYKILPLGSLYAHTGWEGVSISISEIEVDKAINDEVVGYT